MNNATTIDTDKMARAFDLVSPAKEGERLVAAGVLPSCEWTWRDEIAALVLTSEIEAAGVTIDDVRNAVEHYTATKATVRECKVGSRSWERDARHGESRPGYLVTADGYSKGPAA